MWPMKLDMTRDECRGVLRRLELESYGTIVSAFRAQGTLCKEKSRILEDLRRVLHISTDRHRAEARRVANDERLKTVAEIVWGPNSSQDWRREGHRSFPVLPRTVPHTALSYIANTVYEQLTRANSKLPHPAKTSCDRFGKAEGVYKFELIKMESTLAKKGFERDAAIVTSDPLQHIMSRSYIENDMAQVEAARKAKQSQDELHERAIQETQPDENGVSVTENTISPVNEHPSLSDILLDTIKGGGTHSKLEQCKAYGGKSTGKTGERTRKNSQGAKRPAKVKSPYPSGKPSKFGSSKASSLHSPHLIHSYAVPYDVATTTSNGAPSAENVPQLQQHLTSNMPYPQQNANHPAIPGGQLIKSQQYPPSCNFPPQSVAGTSTVFSSSPLQASANVCTHQKCILPSSKKDIQYNLSKLNPTYSSVSGSVRGDNVHFPARSANHVHGKPLLPHPLLNYHKKSPSKNILIPTSTAAATLATLGLPKPLHPPLPEHLNHWDIGSAGAKTCDSNEQANHTKLHHSQEIPDPKVIFSTVPAVPAPYNVEESLRRVVEAEIREGSSVATKTESKPSHLNGAPNNSTGGNTPVKVGALAGHVLKSSAIKATPLLTGFTPVSGGNRLSVHKTQLMPLGGSAAAPSVATGAAAVKKNNVFILPKPSPTGTLNTTGIKMSLPRSAVDLAHPVTLVTRSPPKVIVQSVPDLNNVVTFDPGQEKSTKPPVEKEVAANDDDKSRVDMTKISTESAAAELPLRRSRTPNDGGLPMRKITIASSQLVPFKGTLHGTTLPLIVSPVVPSAKKLKLSTESMSQVTLPADTEAARDWEQELDRTKSTSSAPVQKTNVLVRNIDAEIICTTSRTGGFHYANTDRDRISLRPCAFSAGETVTALQNEYEANCTERGDDSSATDSAAAEEDLDDETSRIEDENDGIEDNDYEEEHTVNAEDITDDLYIEEDHNLDALIEEDPEEDSFVDDGIEDERIEIVNASYNSSRQLVSELEGTEEHFFREEHSETNGILVVPAAINFEQCSDVIETIENGDLHEPSIESKDEIVCELLEIDADGNHHTRQFSYEQALAEGLTLLPRIGKTAHKVNPSVS
ncbi:uncharacterized protein LOC131207660 [Anopheles bellator]|uniref:uncharacterized protein LOC131207660 n=1 Tax=Anopheles bellator TaxID=139047 RepID=UPI002649716D|nr:uncharacterized protein LOC131207660 [Anopheles bellator]